jgi:hypothetical protein
MNKKNKFENIDRICRYLDGEMEHEEKQQFRMELAFNKVLRKDYRLMQLINIAIDNSIRENRLMFWQKHKDVVN